MNMVSWEFITGVICTTLVLCMIIGGAYIYTLQTNKLYASLREECMKSGGSVVESYHWYAFHCIKGIR